MQTFTIHDSHTDSLDRRMTSLVHPGWLSSSIHEAIDANHNEVEESARFTAFAQLMRTAGALDRAATDILASLGVTAGAFFALLELQTVGEAGIAPSELARRLAVARRTATLYVDILVRHGWVSREAHPADKRMILARLTVAGSELLDGVAREYRTQLSRLFASLTLTESVRLQELLNGVPLEPDTLGCAFLMPSDAAGY